MMNLYFTQEEMKDFLLKQGYTIGEYEYDDSLNQWEKNIVKVTYAYKGETPSEWEIINIHNIKYVFVKEIKEKLLNL